MNLKVVNQEANVDVTFEEGFAPDCNFYRSADGRSIITLIKPFQPGQRNLDDYVDSLSGVRDYELHLFSDKNELIFVKRGCLTSYAMNDKDTPGVVTERIEFTVGAYLQNGRMVYPN